MSNEYSNRDKSNVIISRVTKSVVKDMMKARAGRIINIGSIVKDEVGNGTSNYSATKSGLLGFTKSLARGIIKKYKC